MVPNLYSQSSPEAEFSLSIIMHNLACLIFLCVSYFVIHRKVRPRKNGVQNKTEARSDEKMMARIFAIIVTDLLCWFPIIVMVFVSYSGYRLSNIAHIISSTVFLPINSLINPIIYSRLGEKSYQKVKLYLNSTVQKPQKTNSQSGKEAVLEVQQKNFLNENQHNLYPF